MLRFLVLALAFGAGTASLGIAPGGRVAEDPPRAVVWTHAIAPKLTGAPAGTIVRIDAANGRSEVLGRIEAKGDWNFATDCALDPDGAYLWVAQAQVEKEGAHSWLQQIDLLTFEPKQSFALGEFTLDALAFDPQGRLYGAVLKDEPQRLVRLDRGSGNVETVGSLAGVVVRELCFEERTGRLWALDTKSSSAPALVRLDPEDGRVLEKVSLDLSTEATAFDFLPDGRAIVATADGSVYELDRAHGTTKKIFDVVQRAELSGMDHAHDG